jgi:heterotetrameric sarcosine oxidase gamma subunit
MATLEARAPTLPWPQPTPALAVRAVEPMHVLSLRHLPGGGLHVLTEAVAAQGLPVAPGPGRCCGIDPLLIWRSPNEVLLLTQDAALAAAVRAALRPAPGALAVALDLSAGSLVVELHGGGVDALLTRLVDAQAIPRDPGQAWRSRLADIAAVVWRAAPDRAGMLVDRSNAHYLARWMSYVADAV